MSKDHWLPKGYEFSNGLKIRTLKSAGESWQIFEMSDSSRVLVVHDRLVRKWLEQGFLEAPLLSSVKFGDVPLCYLISKKNFRLSPVEGTDSPSNKVDALAFAMALRETRKISTVASFHDSIYIEQYSRLLPTWTLSPVVSDQLVLGTWLTGGVAISTDSFRRLSNLVGWMPASDLADVIMAANLDVPLNIEAAALGRRKSVIEADGNHPAIHKTDSRKTSTNTGAADQLRRFALPGRPELEEFFNEHVIDIIQHPESYQVMGIEFPSATVLHGPPGCGKTYAVERLVEFLDWPSFTIDSNSVGSPYIYGTSRKIADVFNKAIDSSPSVIIIDEMETFLTNRQTAGISGQHHIEEVAEFLRRIPEAINSKVLIVAMTNMIDSIDPAILRRGRFDHLVEVGMPSKAEVVSLLEHLLSKLPKSTDLDLDEALDTLTGKPLSDASFVVREAARLAAKAGLTSLDQESLYSALVRLPRAEKKKRRPFGFGAES